ncbi:MAG: hypothetical protein Q9177_001540 [Variospora cf. flavescens]
MTENDITLRNKPALKAIQRRNHEPWNHLYTLPTHAPQSSNYAQESTTFESDDDRYSRLQRARPSVDLPEGRWTEADFPPPEKLHGQRSQPTSGLSLLFAAGREPPVVDGTQESSGLNMPSVQQQWPDVDSSKTQEDFRWPGNAFDHHSADPAPSIIATDESYLEDCFWQEDHPFAFAVYDTATDIDDSSQAASQHRRPSFAEIDYQSTGHGNSQDLVGSPLVDKPHDGSHSQAFDNGLSSSDDLWTQPIAVPIRPTYNKYKPGIAASYPPATPQHPRHRRSRSKRPLAPRYGDVVSECPTPQSKPLWTANSLCIVHEDGKGGALVPPSTPKKGRRVGRSQRVHQVPDDETVKVGPLDWTSQRIISHLTKDHQRQITQRVEEGFRLLDLRLLLANTATSPEIGVRQMDQQLFKLDLSECRRCLDSERILGVTDSTTIMLFLTGPMKSPSAWMGCMAAHDPTPNPLDHFNMLTTKLSRASYDIHLPSAAPRQLDPEEDDDSNTILMASQLVRIVSRAVELSAFSWLQKEVNSLAQGQKVDRGIAALMQQLGRTALNLRWGICWVEREEVLSDGSDGPRNAYLDRVKALCQTLYVYYAIARRKLPAWAAHDVRTEKTVRSECGDARPIDETLPHDESPEGFERWLQSGHDTIREAGF